MEKISFLVADESLKNDIERTLWTYRNSFGSTHISTEIEIINFPHLIEQGKCMIQKGAQVIITNSGSHQILSGAIDDIPILCLYSSTNDALYTLRKVEHYKKIHLLLNKHFMFNMSACSPHIAKKLQLHPPYSVSTSQNEILKILDKIPVTPDTAIVGCTLLPQIAAHIPMPIYPIRPSESTILSVYQYANELIAFHRKDRKQLSLLTSVLSHVDEGIILYDKEGKISHINKQARIFLKASSHAKKIREIFPDLPYSAAAPMQFKERIIQSPPYTLVVNSAPFQIEKESHYILAIRDVTELQRLEKNIRYKLAKTGLQAAHHFDAIKTASSNMQAVIDTAKIISAYTAPVLIQGESGTGKELFAQSIHNASPRRSGPFVVVNCAALPPELLESELFGYVGGAFTGARKEGKAGYFELAHTGTIFLDEINSMSPNIQSKLLRVLETKAVMRIGSDYIIPLDIRIISASNADIMQAVQSGNFRRDLFFRLNTLTLNLPSLNDRPSDIVFLFSQFLQTLSGQTPSLPPGLKTALEQHHWWGNIRELHSVALRYHIFGNTSDSTYQYLFDQPHTQESQFPLIDKDTLRIDMKQLHKEVELLIIHNLRQQGYTKLQIAKILNISRQTLFNKIKSAAR